MGWWLLRKHLAGCKELYSACVFKKSAVKLCAVKLCAVGLGLKSAESQKYVMYSFTVAVNRPQL